MTKLSEIPDGQAIRLFNGAVDATNYERGYMRWASNVFEIGAEKGGTGTQRPTQINISGTGNCIQEIQGDNGLQFRAGSSIAFRILTNGLDAGSNWRSGLGWRIDGTSAGAGNPDRAADYTTIASGRGTGAGAAAYVSTEAAPVGSSGTSLHVLEPVRFDYVKTTGEPMSALGGMTSSFPAHKRSGAVMQARLADDSAFAALQGRIKVHANATTETVVCTHTIIIQDASGTEYKVPCVPA